jgi:hypothetical protein
MGHGREIANLFPAGVPFTETMSLGEGGDHEH